jgi:chromosomal replication initiator protein
MAYSMAVAVAETPGDRQFNPLFIYGKSGLGKTHLLRSIQNYINKTYPQLQTVYVDTMELVNDYTDAATSKSNKAFNDFKQRYENADVLLIDDVQGLQNKKETLNMVFQILNRMIDHGKQVVLSADRAPKHIDIEERYQSRFNSGITRDIQPPELETKLGIIRNYIEECKHTGSSDFTISPDVQEYIAENSSSNIRELKSAVTKVIFELRNSGKNDITIDEVSKLLIDHFSGGAMKRLSIGEIQKIVEHYYNISHSDLVGKKRSANITYARQIAIYLCRTMIDIPYNNIGTEFNRDHTTVMYSVNSVEEKLKDNRGLNEELEILRQMILEQ